MDHLSHLFNQAVSYLGTVEPIYIYLFLFSFAFAENILPPIPGDVFTIVGGYLSASGKLHLIPTFLCITTGTILSVMFIFAIGYWSGYPYLARKNFKFLSVRDMDKMNNWFSRYGAGLFVISRFLVAVRVPLALAAGIGRYSPLKMAVYSYISTILFQGILIALAYLMHAYIDQLIAGFALYSRIILAILAILIIIWFASRIWRTWHGRQKA